MKIDTAHLGSARIEIEVDSLGQFSATFNDNDYTAKTKAALLEILKKAVKKAAGQGSVDVTVLGLVPNHDRKRGYSNEPYELGIGVVHAKLRAKLERNYNTYLLVSEGAEKQKFQVAGSRDGRIARRLTAAECVQYVNLRQAEKTASDAVKAFEQTVVIRPEDALEAAETNR